MKVIKTLACCLYMLFFQHGLFAQDPVDPAILAYIAQYRSLAIEEMQRTGVPAAIKLAQGIHETDAGRSDLVLRSNNHFGIKCKSSWTGEKVYHDDDARGECFRKYPQAEESYRDHSNYLKSQPRYASLFTLDPMDYKGWAYGLKRAGYATNPRYTQIIIKYIEVYRLNEYSAAAMAAPQHPSGLSLDTISATQPIADTSKGNSNDYVSAIKEIRHIVQPKETLFSLAKKYEVNIEQIKAWNKLESGDLATGQELLIFKKM